MNEQLNFLYNEYSSLKKEYKITGERMTKVKELILLYGGSVDEDPVSLASSLVDPSSSGPEQGYPIKGTWKERILFILKDEHGPFYPSARDISTKLQPLHPEMTVEKLDKAISQYLWSMAKDGDIKVDDSGKRNTYYIEQK